MGVCSISISSVSQAQLPTRTCPSVRRDVRTTKSTDLIDDERDDKVEMCVVTVSQVSFCESTVDFKRILTTCQETLYPHRRSSNLVGFEVLAIILR